MSGPFERGVLISLPALELARTTPPASVFAVEALDATNLSPKVRSALDLVATCALPGQPRWIVARPEMFTDGATLAWLAQTLGGVLDHVALSDGAAVRRVPGLRNHVYFHDLGQIGRLEALERLERRAAESFTQLDSQINSALVFRWKGRRFAPPTQGLVGEPPAPETAPVLRPLALDADARERGAAFAPAAEPYARLHYLRLSESALREPAVARRVTAWVADALADPGCAVVWALPESASDEAGRLAMLAQCLRAGGGRWPSLMPNVFFAAADLGAETLKRLGLQRRLVTDALADFSHLAPEFLDAFSDILVYALSGRHMPAQLRDLLRVVYGPQTQIDWLRAHDRAERP